MSMIEHEYLDKIINKYEISTYESLLSSGISGYVEKCSKSIQINESINYQDKINLLYLMKYVYHNWSGTDRSSRLHKQLSLKTLFAILLTSKKISKWRELLETSVNIISEYWEITSKEYPFLTKDEEKRIISTINDSLKVNDVERKFNSIDLDKIKKILNKEYFFDGFYKEYLIIYKKITNINEKNSKELKIIKGYLIAICEQKITNKYPAILKTLPIQFCFKQINNIFSKINKTGKAEDITAYFSKEIFSDFNKMLFYKDNITNNVKPIPTWAAWFFYAGRKAATEYNKSNKLVIGISLPAKEYATLFFLLGLESFNAQQKVNEKDLKSYFNYIKKSKQNEALLILENKRWKRCWYKGTESINGQEFIKVEVPGAKKKQHIDLIPEVSIPKIRKAIDPNRKVAANQVGFEMNGLDSLVKYYDKNESDILMLLLRNNLRFLVFGNILALKQEIDTENIYFKSKNKYEKFSFQDVIRFKNFMTDFDISRGTILSSREHDEENNFDPDVVVYDGSLSYINNQDVINNSLEVIFLDRTEPQFSNAISELMARYYEREKEISFFNKVPSQIEVISFKE